MTTKYLFKIDTNGKVLSGIKLEYEATEPFYDSAMYTIEGTEEVYNNGHNATFVNGEWTISSDDPAVILANAIAAKVAELNAACNNALQTFTSDALGTVHTYLSDKEEAWPLLIGEYGFVIGPDFDNNPISWYTVEAGFQSHTGAQFRKVYTDGRAWVQYCKVKCDELSKQAQAATTVLQVQAIVWD